MTRRTETIAIFLGICIALTMIAVTSISLKRHPPVPPASHIDCPAHDPGNPSCIR